jgi:hypothetical protein
MMNTQLYSGFDAFGRVIPTVAHAAQIRQIYRRIGQKLQPGTEEWLANAERRGQAMDAAAEDALPLDGGRNNEELNRIYAACLLSGDTDPSYEPLSEDYEGRSETTRQFGEQFRRKMVRTPEEDAAALKKFCQVRGWDAEDPNSKKNFDLCQFYEEQLRQAQPLRRIEQRRGGFKKWAR